jgi:uncharacterized protein with HEPN domain
MNAGLADQTVAEHIVRAVDDFEHCLSDISVEILGEDRLRRLAVERSLEIMWNALNLLPTSARTREAQIDWKGITNLISRLRFKYYQDNSAAILKMANRNLPPLRAFARRVIREAKGNRAS